MRVDEFPPYPFTDNLLVDEEKQKKKLIKYYCYQYASWLQADGEEITATNLAEYAVDQLFEHEDYTDHVYDFLDDPDHWVWDVAMEAQEKFEK